MGTEMKSQGIGPVLLEEGIIKMCVIDYHVVFCFGPCSHLVQLEVLLKDMSSHSCWQSTSVPANGETMAKKKEVVI